MSCDIREKVVEEVLFNDLRDFTWEKIVIRDSRECIRLKYQKALCMTIWKLFTFLRVRMSIYKRRDILLRQLGCQTLFGMNVFGEPLYRLYRHIMIKSNMFSLCSLESNFILVD